MHSSAWGIAARMVLRSFSSAARLSAVRCARNSLTGFAGMYGFLRHLKHLKHIAIWIPAVTYSGSVIIPLAFRSIHEPAQLHRRLSRTRNTIDTKGKLRGATVANDWRRCDHDVFCVLLR